MPLHHLWDMKFSYWQINSQCSDRICTSTSISAGGSVNKFGLVAKQSRRFIVRPELVDELTFPRCLSIFVQAPFPAPCDGCFALRIELERKPDIARLLGIHIEPSLRIHRVLLFGCHRKRRRTKALGKGALNERRCRAGFERRAGHGPHPPISHRDVRQPAGACATRSRHRTDNFSPSPSSCGSGGREYASPCPPAAKLPCPVPAPPRNQSRSSRHRAAHLAWGKYRRFAVPFSSSKIECAEHLPVSQRPKASGIFIG